MNSSGTLECRNCGEVFTARPDHPRLTICHACLPDLKHLPDYCCPACGWNSDVMLGEPDAPCEILDLRSHYEWIGAETWRERWTCPECGQVFEFGNSSC